MRCKKRRCTDCEKCRCGPAGIGRKRYHAAWCTDGIWGPIKMTELEKRKGMGAGCKFFVSMDDQ